MVLERNISLGGKAGDMVRHGHNVTHFSHLIGGINVRNALREVGREKDVKFIRNPNIGRFVYDNKTFNDPFSLLRELEPRAIRIMVEAVSAIPEGGHEKYFEMTCEEYFKKYEPPQPLYDLLCMFNGLFFCHPFSETSAGELLLSFRMMSLGPPAFPVGGISRIPEVFAEVVKSNGGEVRTNDGAEEIVIENGRAIGVLNSDGVQYKAKAVVSNAGIKATCLNLSKAKSFPPAYMERMLGLTPSLGAITARYYLNKKITDAGTTIAYPENMERLSIAARNGEVPDQLYMYVTAPSIYDETLSPAGKQAIIAGALAPTDPSLDFTPWYELMDKEMERTFPGILDASEHIDHNSSSFIASISGRENLPDGNGGECIGIAQTPNQVGKNKPDPRTPVKSLYLVGCDAGGAGVGLDQAAQSAWNVAKIISGDLEQ